MIFKMGNSNCRKEAKEASQNYRFPIGQIRSLVNRLYDEIDELNAENENTC